jgi:cyclopropane-fatty-acyl-phospholipid synthase
VSAPARYAVHAILARVRAGQIELRETYSGRAKRFGPADAHLSATVEVRDPRFYEAVALGRSVGLGESYADRFWDCEDLVSLLRIGASEMFRLDPARRRVAPLIRPLHRLAMLPLLNTRGGARRNVAAHYDLGNELFETFLDTQWMCTQRLLRGPRPVTRGGTAHEAGADLQPPRAEPGHAPA